jgi:zinc transport system permease protein
MNTHIILTALALALVAGPLGCFVVWRRMAYFGDGLAHSALLGVAVGLVIGISHQIGMMVIAVVFALLLIWLRSKRVLATDTLLGILAHAALSLGVVAMALLGAGDVELHDYLLGSLDQLTPELAVWVIGGAGLSLGLLLRLWPGLILMTTSEELAHAEGVSIMRYEFALMVLMGVVVAAAIQMVGILLITSLLIIPASTARLLARTPEQMAVGGSLIASLAMLIGLPSAQSFDLATGPMIVCVSVALFIIVLVGRLVLRSTAP